MQKLLIILMIITSTTVTSQVQNIHETYALDHQKSVLHWKGSYTFDIVEYNGVVYFKRGELTTVGEKITGGSFVIDMLSIDNVPYSNKKGPIEHLKDPDFFDVYKFPEAKLLITNVVYFSKTNTHEVSADLTIKGVTQSITFYAEIDGIKKTMNAHFKIDRTRWGITYNNKVKNNAISDAVEFEAELYF